MIAEGGSEPTATRPATPAARVGVVVIGRNEGQRLVRCLASLRGRSQAVVYVDSGSTDASVAAARAAGAEVVALDTSIPFTAARARNAGFERLQALIPDLAYVQFVDGDCEVQDGWIEAAADYLDANATVAVVCGRRRERNPDTSRYNQIIDVEWDTPIGVARSCGGDAMIRTDVLRAAGGFDPALIAGEEPELCFRIRRAGHLIFRLDRAMTLHDAAMFRFGQFWRRCERSGHAYAELAAMHGGPPHRLAIRPVASIVVWSTVPLILSVVLLQIRLEWAAVPVLAYAIPWLRARRVTMQRGYSPSVSSLYASSCVIGKFAEFAGVVRFALNRWVFGRRSGLIEYKT